MTDFRIAPRLGAAFGLVLLMALASAGAALYKLAAIQGNLERIVTDNDVKIEQNERMAAAVHVVARVVRTVALLDDKGEAERQRQKIQVARERYDQSRQVIERLPATEQGLRHRAAIDAAQAAARPLNDRVLALGLEGRRDDATRLLMAEAGPATQAWLDMIDAYTEFQRQANAAEFAQAQADYRLARGVLVGSAVLMQLLAIVLAWRITRSIVGPLRAAGAVAERIARGDLTVAVPAGGRDEAGALLAALGRMQDELRRAVTAVRENAEGVATASAQIAHGNQDLSQRTEEQASALEQTASSMEELGSTVALNADNAQQANQLAMAASQVAARGGDVMAQLVQRMHEIGQSSQRIGDITGVIDGIAFQTNILALNAAVEAARAGEQGRGFAVVAAEVRSLAQRSASAAQEIKRLIGDSEQRVQQGGALADDAGRTIGESVLAIRRVTDLMGEISAASREQSAGVQQVGQAVTEMDRVTQQNAALVEQSAAAAESLRGQSLQLLQAVAVFRTPAGGGQGAVPARCA
jgi:methyl-accepting chemotaxis protein